MKAGKIIIPMMLVLFVAGVYFVGVWVVENKLPFFGATTHLYVYPTTTAEDVLNTLQKEGNPRLPSQLNSVFEKYDIASRLKPGHYVVEKGKPAVYAARVLINGWQTPVRLTLSGTLRKKEVIARRISSQMMVDSLTVLNALNDEALLSKFGYTPSTVFAMFMPDTYEMYWNSGIETILEKQAAAVDAFWTKENLGKAGKLHLDKIQVATLASIVDSETNCTREMPKIAGVYLNRLAIGMPLQADPTIAYIYKFEPNRILKYMLQAESPYNTYKYKGLPPGPICVPCREALEASLNPDRENNNLFFCADPSFNGTHRFASSYSEHCANAKAFQRALDERTKK